MYNPQIKIISSENKWTTFKYVASNARSRMATLLLNIKYKNGEVDILNPEKLYKREVEA